MQPCFPQLPRIETAMLKPSPVKAWLSQYTSVTPESSITELKHALQTLPNTQQVALGRLIPLLICGEQSSQWVFHNESQRLQTTLHNIDNKVKIDDAVHCFNGIVSDEQYHEQALHLVLDALPPVDDLHKIKRRSQLFFVSLGSCDSLQAHFAQITCLDALVCKIMQALEKSAFPPAHPFVLLCRAIKQDEARHVSLSKQHANDLGFPSQQWQPLRLEIKQKLETLLRSEQHAFDAIGVDLTAIFDSRRKVDPKRSHIAN